MPKLKDIAQHVGVSISTVSRVINNDQSRHISAETKSKVWKAIKELGYEPKRSEARANHDIEGQGTAQHQIGCIVSVPQNKYNHPYFSPILAGIDSKLNELGYSLAYMLTQEEVKDEATLRHILKDKKLEGMIIVEGVAPEIYAHIKESVSAIVGIDISDPTVPVITYDRMRAVKLAVRHLISQGHQKIGFIGGSGMARDLKREKRYRGYQEALEEAGIEVNSDWVMNAGWNVDLSYSLMSDLLKRDRQDWPTAVFAASDMMAISAMRAVTEKGLKIPEDMAFVGLDNIEVSQYTSPPLTTVHIPKLEIGMMAAKVLIDHIEGSYPLPFKLMMPFELLLRQSSSTNK